MISKKRTFEILNKAKYGDKLSSVLDVKYKEPRQNKKHFSISSMGTNLTLQGNNKNYRKFKAERNG